MDILNDNAGVPDAGASAVGSPDTVSAAGQAAPGAPGASGAPGAGPLGPIPPGAGRLNVGTPVLDVKVNAVAPSVTSGMDADAVMNILHNLDVEGVREAASAHTALGETLERIAENLVANGQTLAGSWQGDAAQSAVTKFQQMHAQTSQIAAQAKQTGQVLEWTASIMDQYRKLPTPLGGPAPQAGQPDGTPGAAIGDIIAVAAAVPGAGHQAKANAQAQKYLNELNQHLVTANSSLPSSIGHSTAASPVSAAHSGAAAGVPGGAGRAAGGPASGRLYPGAGAGSAAGAGSVSPAGAPAPTFTPAPHAPSAAALQSSAVPGSTGTVAPPAPAPAAPGGGTAGGFVPFGPVSGGAPATGSLGNTTDEDPSEEESQLAAVEDSEATSNATIGDRKQNAESGEGAGLPMMGAPGAGQADEERLRESWINEDKNIWGVPQGTVGAEIGSH